MYAYSEGQMANCGDPLGKRQNVSVQGAHGLPDRDMAL